MSDTGYWYCANCREEVGSYHVTHGELHESCGHPVSWIEPGSVEDSLRARVAELERDLATEQERSEGWRDRAGAATQRVAELEQTVEQLESDACDEREAVAAAESRASAAEQRVRELERELLYRRDDQRMAEYSGLAAEFSKMAAVAAEQRAKRLEGALRNAAEIAAAMRDHEHDGNEESGEHDAGCAQCALEAMRGFIDAALAASEGARGGEGKPRCVCTGADCDHSDGGPCACGCNTPCDAAEDECGTGYPGVSELIGGES